mmetsp:Transcript_94407/g.256334  ORF Transcript_94407/g.256334 Transcript_94407/m.256334 type:complete len:405 (-) Transcript_94407:1079-2293(-)
MSRRGGTRCLRASRKGHRGDGRRPGRRQMFRLGREGGHLQRAGGDAEQRSPRVRLRPRLRRDRRAGGRVRALGAAARGRVPQRPQLRRHLLRPDRQRQDVHHVRRPRSSGRSRPRKWCCKRWRCGASRVHGGARRRAGVARAGPRGAAGHQLRGSVRQRDLRPPGDWPGGRPGRRGPLPRRPRHRPRRPPLRARRPQRGPRGVLGGGGGAPALGGGVEAPRAHRHEREVDARPHDHGALAGARARRQARFVRWPQYDASEQAVLRRPGRLGAACQESGRRWHPGAGGHARRGGAEQDQLAGVLPAQAARSRDSEHQQGAVLAQASRRGPPQALHPRERGRPRAHVAVRALPGLQAHHAAAGVPRRLGQGLHRDHRRHGPRSRGGDASDPAVRRHVLTGAEEPSR